MVESEPGHCPRQGGRRLHSSGKLWSRVSSLTWKLTLCLFSLLWLLTNSPLAPSHPLSKPVLVPSPASHTQSLLHSPDFALRTRQVTHSSALFSLLRFNGFAPLLIRNSLALSGASANPSFLPLFVTPLWGHSKQRQHREGQRRKAGMAPELAEELGRVTSLRCWAVPGSPLLWARVKGRFLASSSLSEQRQLPPRVGESPTRKSSHSSGEGAREGDQAL